MSSKKNQKSTDEQLDKAVVESGEFLQKNQKQIFIAVIVVLLLVCGYFAYKHFVELPKTQKAQVAMIKGEQYYRAGMDSIALFGDDNGYIGFEGIIKEYGSSANLAKLYAAICYYNMDDNQKALDYAKEFSSNDKIVSHLKDGLIGDCLLNQGKIEESIPYFEKAAKNIDNAIQSPVLYKKAGLAYRDLGRYDKVITTFTFIKDNYMASPIAMEADKYIEEAKLQK